MLSVKGNQPRLRRQLAAELRKADREKRTLTIQLLRAQAVVRKSTAKLVKAAKKAQADAVKAEKKAMKQLDRTHTAGFKTIERRTAAIEKRAAVLQGRGA